jgi:F-type H+-transporting ATPase subunit b
MRRSLLQPVLRTALCCGLLFAAGTAPLHAQDTPAQGAPEQQASNEAAQQQGQLKWKLINTAIFAALLGYMIYKSAPRFFNARSADIQRAIQEATGLKLDADLRYSEVDRKMATLAEEVKRLRAQAAAEMELEHQRMREESAHERDHIQRNVAAEVEALREQGIRQVQRLTASAALDLAEQSLRDRAAGHQNEFLQDFIHLVEGAK